MLTHWKKLNNPDYLGAYAFDRGEEKLATIKEVRRETITGAEGKKSEETVLYFTQPGLKPLILNSTNAKAIEKLFKTPYIEEWSGKSIALVVREVKAFGDIVDAVRVKLERLSVCQKCGKRIEAAGNMSAQEVEQYTKNKFSMALCADCAKKLKGSNGQ